VSEVVVVTNDVRVDLRVCPRLVVDGRLVRGNVEVLAPAPRPDADLAHRVGALLDGEEVLEHVEAVDEGVLAVRDDLAPFRAVAFLADLGLHQAVVRRLPVGADDPAALEVVDVVLEVALCAGRTP
jgi:hypothetical protein